MNNFNARFMNCYTDVSLYPDMYPINLNDIMVAANGTTVMPVRSVTNFESIVNTAMESITKVMTVKPITKETISEIPVLGQSPAVSITTKTTVDPITYEKTVKPTTAARTTKAISTEIMTESVSILMSVQHGITVFMDIFTSIATKKLILTTVEQEVATNMRVCIIMYYNRCMYAGA